MKNFTFIDLFSGLGGFRVALNELGGVCKFSSDIDSHARDTYFSNFGEYPTGDITKVAISDIPSHDILCAGFPCQPFSIAGKRLGFEDARGTLFFEVAKIIKEKQPKAIFLENVAGLTNHNNGKTLDVISTIIDNLGYWFSMETMNAKDYGTPQNRNRWYGVGLRKDLFPKNCFSFPDKCPLEFTIKDIILNDANESYSISQVANNNIMTHIQKHIDGPRYVFENILIANEIRKSRVNFRSDGILPCLTAKMGTGGNNIPVVVAQKRKLTERECLSAMGFPDWYKIKANNMQSYKQIGNSVVVPVIKKIAFNIVQLINDYTT